MSTTQTIQSLISAIERNEYFLPEFQRGFCWTPDQVKKYIQSLYQGYPTGSFLIWKANLPSKIRGESGSENRNFTNLILDGQQRLTTLYTLLRGNPPNWIEGTPPRTDLYFNLNTEEFQYFTRTLMTDNQEWVSVIDILKNGASNYIKNPEHRNYIFFDDSDNRFDKLTKIENITKYQYYINSVEEQDPVKVVEIFNLVNSTGTPLSSTDLALALMTGRWEECKNKMREAIQKYRQARFSFSMDFFMRCITVIGTSRGVFDDIQKLNQSDFIEAWDKTQRSLNYLIQILPTHAYIDENSFLTTDYIFFPLIYYISQNNFRFPDDRTRNQFIYWIYNALMWGRYSGSSQSLLDRDIRILKETNSVEELIKQIAQSRGGNLEVAESDLELQGSRSRFYQIFYILVRRNGAADWTDSSLPLYYQTVERNYSIELHHIFPKSKLYRGLFRSNSSYDKSLVNEIANMAFITSATNRRISNKEPEIYLAEVDPEQLRRQFIPLDPSLWKLEKNAYESFIKERRRLLAEGINQLLHKLYHGNTIYVSQDVGSLRNQVTEIELVLRRLIIDVAAENEDDIDLKDYIPSQFTEKLNNRIKSYLRDNPSESTETLNSLDKKIEFFDLSEYCDLMISKNNWIYFEQYFGNKSALQERFRKLQILRNSLAHNRDLTEVVIKEGEAAILWLSGALRKYLTQ